VAAAATAAALGMSAAATAQPVTGTHANTKPTIVLIHGAWSGPASWNGEVTALQRKGYTVRAITDPLRQLDADSASVADFVKTIRGPVVLVGHSYGGSVISNAAAQVSNVKALVYVDAYLPEVGETSQQLNGAGSVLLTEPASQLYDQVPLSGAQAGTVDTYLKLPIVDRYFGNDLPFAVNHRLWATQGAATTTAFATPSKAAAWKTIPSWAFVSTGDRIITPASQLAMAKRAHAHITVYRGGSHLTLISHPAAVTTVILEAAHSVR
jgi:pimeloyl-ACP methyl ester carboxylesterase